MGGKRYKKGNKHDGVGGKRQRNDEDQRDPRGDKNESGGWINGFMLENEVFDAFYKAQYFVDDGEWENFKTFLQKPLPACFRLNPNYLFVDKLSDELMSLMGKKIEATETTPEIDAVSKLTWCPNAYKMAVDKRVIRKQESLRELHEWMKQHTENGNITRQEAVSMVPPLALNISPHHKCLDLCAAPGSKTTQILEIINRSLDGPEDQQGLIVANDCDSDRAYMLTHQCRRINSPLLMITVHPGQSFPRIYDGSGESGVFDRVLCDVPCSGDGTLRKNPTIWKKWTTASGCALHPLQLQIARRGFQLTKSGGLMVYSTCSLSPYENESCVAEILRQSDGKLELIDGRQFLPNFKARPGLTTWNVLDDYPYCKKKKEEEGKSTSGSEMNSVLTEESIGGNHVGRAVSLGLAHYKTYEDVPENRRNAFRKTMFPPTPEEVEWMHLERCLRCLPQDEDTGGFFVATFRKLSSSSTDQSVFGAEETEAPAGVASSLEETRKMDWLCPSCKSTNFLNRESCYSCKAIKPVDAELVPRNQKQNKGKFQQKGGVDYHAWDKESYEFVRNFYGFSDSLSPDAFYVRDDFNNTNRPKKGKSSSSGGDEAGDQNINTSKSVYYMPAPLRKFMMGDNKDQLKIVTAGLKLLDRKSKGPSKDPACEYRILQEAVDLVADNVQKRKVSITAQDFCNVLEGGLVSLRSLAEESLHAISQMEPGPFICTYKYQKSDEIRPETDKSSLYSVNEGHSFHAMCWKGTGQTLNVMCTKVELESMKHKFSALGLLRPKVSLPPLTSTANPIEAESQAESKPVATH